MTCRSAARSRSRRSEGRLLALRDLPPPSDLRYLGELVDELEASALPDSLPAIQRADAEFTIELQALAKSGFSVGDRESSMVRFYGACKCVADEMSQSEAGRR